MVTFILSFFGPNIVTNPLQQSAPNTIGPIVNKRLAALSNRPSPSLESHIVTDLTEEGLPRRKRARLEEEGANSKETNTCFLDKPDLVKRESLQKLNENALKRVEHFVLAKVKEHDCLKDFPEEHVFRLLSIDIRDNFGRETTLESVVSVWMNNLNKEFSEKELEKICRALRLIRAFMNNTLHAFSHSNLPDGPNSFRFSLANFDLNDQNLVPSEKIAKLAPLALEGLKKTILTEAKKQPSLKRLEPSFIWSMIRVAVRENFGHRTTTEDFVAACLKKLSRVPRGSSVKEVAKSIYILKQRTNTLNHSNRGISRAILKK